MKNSLILVLVLLVLYFIYTNLQNNLSMEGGANVDCSKFEKIVKKLTDSDLIYRFTLGTTPGLIIYVLIFLILIGVGIHYGRQSLYINGTTLPGIGNIAKGYSMIDWMTSGLYKFYTVRQDMYFYTGKNSAGNSKTTTAADEAEFTKLINELRTPEYKDTVHYFCDQVLPCNRGSMNTACTCKDPNGKQLPQCQDKKVLSPSAFSILESKKKMSQHFFGIIPKCCCTKLGDGVIRPDPAYPIIASNLTIELPSCSDGSSTVKPIEGSTNKTELKASDLKNECKDINCKDEPDYKLLSIPLYTPSGDINPAWTVEASKYPTAQEIVSNTPSAELQLAFQNSTFANSPNASEYKSAISQPSTAVNSTKESPYAQQILNQTINTKNPNLLTNSKEKFTEDVLENTKKISPFAKIIEAQVDKLKKLKEPDNIETLLTEVPVKSNRIRNLKK
jgi:hypothetical protein